MAFRQLCRSRKRRRKLPINPYGRTKLIAEQMLQDYAAAYGLRYVALRYFNACGADPDGELGEWHDPETHLIPRACLRPRAGSRIWRSSGTTTKPPTEPAFATTSMSPIWRGRMCLPSTISMTGGENLAVNLGTGRGSSVREIMDTVGRITDRAGANRTASKARRRSAGALCRSGPWPASRSVFRRVFRSRHDRADRRALLRTGGAGMMPVAASAAASRASRRTADGAAARRAIAALNIWLGAAVWLAALVYFWAWWLEPDHYRRPFRLPDRHACACVGHASAGLLPGRLLSRAASRTGRSACRPEAASRWS